jgi:RNA polymerase sigma factor (TIGR02999 family)
MSERDRDLASLIHGWRNGDSDARNLLVEAVHDELSEIASFVLRRENQPLSIVTTDLVHEAILRLLQSSNLELVDRAHLLALSARIMRNILVDRARSKDAQKRNAIVVTLSADAKADDSFDIDLLALEVALIRLHAIAPERAKIVEMRFYGGMTNDEIAVVLGVSPSTAHRSWTAARLWLREAIARDIKP